LKPLAANILIFAASFIAVHIAWMPQADAEVERFNFIPSSSKIVFHAKSTLHDFDGSASSISGFAEGDIEHPDEKTNGLFEATVSSMSTNDSWRDQYMIEDMDAAHFPTITFRLKNITIVRNRVSERDPYLISINGTLRMHGVERQITFPATLSVSGALLKLKATVSLSLRDYGIKPTSFLFLKVQDTVIVDFDLNGSRA
jgi:polyisoprenoid-binding protein YceI